MKVNDSTLRVWVTSAWMALGLCVFVISLVMENPIGQPIGPGYVPSLVALCMAISAAWSLVGDIRMLRQAKKLRTGTDLKPAAADPAEGGELRVLVSGGLAYVLSIFVWESFGYLIGLSAITFVMVLIDRKIKVKWALPYSVFIVISLWLIFNYALQVDLG